jgi:hypothetical protein
MSLREGIDEQPRTGFSVWFDERGWDNFVVEAVIGETAGGDRRAAMTRRAMVSLVLAMLALVLSLAMSAGPASAVPPNVQAGLSLSPTTASVGTTVHVTATAANLTASTIAQVSMGVDIPATLVYSGLVRPAHATCRATFVTNHRLVYCSVSLAPHETATLGVTVTPSAAGSFTLRSYARQTYTTNDTYAYATLTVP